MSDAMQIGQVEAVEGLEKTVFTRRLLVRDGELATAAPAIDDPADSWTGVKGAYVTEVRRKGLAPGREDTWLVEVQAELADSDTKSYSTALDDSYDPKYSFGEIYFPLAWWGAHKASLAEAGGHPRDEAKAKFNPYGRPCQQNEIIFDNASCASPGLPNYELCPFACDSPAVWPPAMLSWDWKNQSVGTVLYEIYFYLKGNLAAFANARGVNKAGGFPSQLKPFDARGHKWLLVSQELLSANGRGGQTYAHIKRVFQYAPGELLWLPGKNGGELSWRGE